MKNIKQKNTKISDIQTFTCHNCGCVFESDKFRISKEHKYLRTINKGSGILSMFSTEWIQVYKNYYSLTTKCPVCKFWAETLIDCKEPEEQIEFSSGDFPY